MEAGLLEAMMDVLTEEHAVEPTQVRQEALRLYLNLHPALKLDGAVALWRKGRVSLAKAAEIAGLTVPEIDLLLLLFHKVYVASAVYHELLQAERVGLTWVNTV
jgi:predicted HTH domain antitoxin